MRRGSVKLLRWTIKGLGMPDAQGQCQAVKVDYVELT